MNRSPLLFNRLLGVCTTRPGSPFRLAICFVLLVGRAFAQDPAGPLVYQETPYQSDQYPGYRVTESGPTNSPVIAEPLSPEQEIQLTSPPIVLEDKVLRDLSKNSDSLDVIDGATPEEKLAIPDFFCLSTAPYQAYRVHESMFSYMPGDGDQFGWMSFMNSNYLKRGKTSGFEVNANIHLLSGPLSVDLPPRLYDFEAMYQARDSFTEYFSYDLAVSVGVYSDFEDSARDGVRFPGHAVGMFHTTEKTDVVMGVDYLDRDDIKILPVFGLSIHDPARPHLRYDLIFPRPRVTLTLNSKSRMYWGGLLGGGTWDIEFPDESNDVMTYRDYRAVMGFENVDSNGKFNSWEFGFVFGRHLQFRDRADELNFDNAFLFQSVTTY